MNPYSRGQDLFTDILFNTTPYDYSLSPPKGDNKGKSIASGVDPSKPLMSFLEQSRSSLKLPNLNQFSASGGGHITLDEAKA
ncbi:hypothetical protein Tco_1013617 [Tanacetum coccineum]